MYIRSNSNSFKTFLVFLISFFLVYSPTRTYASNNIGGWTLSNPVAQGAKVAYDGLKNVMINGANVTKKATAIIAPNANEVAKVLGKGVAGVALSVAVEQLLGAVDWVLDPANNEIRYKIPIDPSCDTKCLFTTESYLPKAETASKACSIWFASLNLPPGYSGTVSFVQDNWKPTNPGYCFAPILKDGVFSSNALIRVTKEVVSDQNEDRQASIPLPHVAAQVIANAESDSDPKRKADAQSAILAAAADIVDEAEKDATKAPPILKQLENGATAETDELAKGETKPNSETGGTDISLTFPVFCTWAPTVCEAMNVVIAFPTTIAEYMTAVKDWATADSEELTKPEPPDIEEPDLNIAVTNYIQFASQCPVDREIPLSMGGQTLNLVISYQALCTVAQQFRPAVILMAFLAGAFIITNTGRRAETGD